MNRDRLLREIPIGLGIVALVGGVSYFVRWTFDRQRPHGAAPPPGETLTGDAAAKLHPPVTPAPVDRKQFATLPPECSCGTAQLLLQVQGSQQSISDQGMATYVVHDVALAIQASGSERVVRLPVTDDTAPPARTEGFATRFDLACNGDRLVVVDPTHATLWDLAGTPRRVWTTALPSRRTPVVAESGQLSIQCGAAKIEGEDVTIDTLRIAMSSGAVRTPQ